jgi:hypothetical protein
MNTLVIVVDWFSNLLDVAYISRLESVMCNSELG